MLAEGSKAAGAFGHGYTYSGHPVAMKAAMVNLDIIEQQNLLQNVEDKGIKLKALLENEFLNSTFVGDVRGYGLLAAVEFVKSKSPLVPFPLNLKVAQRIARAAFNNGLIVRPLAESNTLAFSPTFIVTDDELSRMVNIFAASVKQVFEELQKSGDLKT